MYPVNFYVFLTALITFCGSSFLGWSGCNKPEVNVRATL